MSSPLFLAAGIAGQVDGSAAETDAQSGAGAGVGAGAGAGVSRLSSGDSIPHRARRLAQPLQVSTAALLPGVPGEDIALDEPSTLLMTLTIDQALVDRLFQLWNAVIAADADEIGDWAMPTSARFAVMVDPSSPKPMSLCASVYANGEVAFAVAVEDFEASLALQDQIDLNDLMDRGGLQAQAGVTAGALS